MSPSKNKIHPGLVGSFPGSAQPTRLPEQASTNLESLLQEKAQLAVKKLAPDAVVLDEFMMVNNDLINSQRELIKSNHRLEQQEVRFREIIQKSPDPIFILDPEARVLFMNHAAVCIADRPGAHPFAVGEILSFPKSQTGEVVLTNDRDQLKIFDLLQVDTTWDEKPASFVSLRDITTRKRTEKNLRKERNFSNAVVQMVGSLIVVFDQKGCIKRFNRACEKTTGYTFTEAKGLVLWDFLLTPEDAVAVKKAFDRFATGHFPSTYENWLVTKDGSKRLIVWNNTALQGDDGQIEYIISTGVDITEQRESEAFRKREMHTLEEMSAPIPAGVTASTLGVKCLREAAPDLFARLTELFAGLMEQAVEMLAVKVEYDIPKGIRSISDTLGAMRAGPRDATEIFLASLKKNCTGVKSEKCRVYREEGRIMLIELIGKLAVYYRNHCLGSALSASVPASLENGKIL